MRRPYHLVLIHLKHSFPSSKNGRIYPTTLSGEASLRVINFRLSLTPSTGQFWVITTKGRRLFAGGNFKLGSTARIAVLNVGAVCTHVETQSHFKIRVLHEPSSVDPSHSGIHDTIQDELMISELIAEKVLETYPAVTPL